MNNTKDEKKEQKDTINDNKHQGPMKIKGSMDIKSPIVKIDQKPMISCFSFKYPYACFESIKPNHIMIINCNEPDLIHNIEFCGNTDKFIDTFITE